MRLPAEILAGATPRITREQLVETTRWKMLRGVWRARNLKLVESNSADAVLDASEAALAAVPDSRAPIRELARLSGVGPATASALAAAAAPEHYPFFDEQVAAQVPGLEGIGYTLGDYARYAEALRKRAQELGDDWTPVLVERALWANSGGKAGVP